MESIIDLAIAVLAGYGGGQFAAPRVPAADLGRSINGITGAIGGFIAFLLLEWLAPWVWPTEPPTVNLAGTATLVAGGFIGGAAFAILAGLVRGRRGRV